MEILLRSSKAAPLQAAVPDKAGRATEIVAYCRVSSDEQRVHGLGLEALLVAIQDHAYQVEHETSAVLIHGHHGSPPIYGNQIACTAQGA